MPKLNGQQDYIDGATHAISDARVTRRKEIGFSYFVCGAAVADALAQVVASTAAALRDLCAEFRGAAAVVVAVAGSGLVFSSPE